MAPPYPHLPSPLVGEGPAGDEGWAAGAALHVANLTVATPAGIPVVENTDLSLAPGAHIAILGPSGVGKSTLVEALAGLRDFEGSVTLDGADLLTLPATMLRARVGFIGQRPRLFAGTIGDNIRLGRPTACATAVRAAAQRALVTRFADALPLGLDTPVGEDGLGLSGGEAQRIALARLYLRDPGLILLDEPTAHLDAATEDEMLDQLLVFARRRTLVVSTHSAAVAARMDRVYRLAGGTLLEAPRPHVVRPAPLKGAA